MNPVQLIGNTEKATSPISEREQNVRHRGVSIQYQSHIGEYMITADRNNQSVHVGYASDMLGAVERAETYLNNRELDYVTDVSGNRLLKDRSISCFTLDNKVFVTIKMLGFCGSPTELLREHGMIYYSEGENTLRIQERLDRRARLKLDLGK